MQKFTIRSIEDVPAAFQFARGYTPTEGVIVMPMDMASGKYPMGFFPMVTFGGPNASETFQSLKIYDGADIAVVTVSDWDCAAQVHDLITMILAEEKGATVVQDALLPNPVVSMSYEQWAEDPINRLKSEEGWDLASKLTGIGR